MTAQGRQSPEHRPELVLHATQVPNAVVPAPALVPLVPDYATMTVVELDAVVRDSIAECHELMAKFRTEFNTRLYRALLELEYRFEKQPGTRNDLKLKPKVGWHDYLRSVGVKPATFRAWKSRHTLDEAQQHFFPKAKASHSGGSSKPCPASIEQTNGEAQILAEAGISLMAVVLDPALDDVARLETARRMAQEMAEAVSVGRIDTLAALPLLFPEATPTAKPTERPDELTMELVQFVIATEESPSAWQRIRKLAQEIHRTRGNADKD